MLVPYRAALPTFPTYPRARMAMYLAKYGAKHIPTAIRAARRIQRVWRGRKRRQNHKLLAAKRYKFSARNVGAPVGVSNAKRSTVVDDTANFNSRSLDVKSLLQIAAGTSINTRERHIINVRGIKICCEIKNTTAAPFYVNLAILAPKGNATGVVTTDFFRDSGPTRARDFDTTLTSNELHCLPINADRYTVLRHKRFRLVPGNAATATQSHQGYSYANYDVYIPIKRQIRYDTASSADPESGNIFVCHWGDRFDTAGGAASVANEYRVTMYAVTYFKEPK